MKPLHLVLCSVLLMGGCSTSKKFNFDAAYKFSYYDYSKQSVSPSPPADNLVASSNMFLGRELINNLGMVDDDAMEAETRKIMGRLNPNFDNFSVGTLIFQLVFQNFPV